MTDRDIDTWLALDEADAQEERFAERRRQREQGYIT